MARTPAFARYVRRLLGREGRRLGWKPKAGESLETAGLRGTVLTLLGRYGRVPWVLRGARRRARAFLADPAKAELATAALALNLATHEGHVSEPELEAALAKAGGPYARNVILGAMGRLPADKGLKKALAFSLTDAVPLQNKANVFFGTLDTPAGRRVAITFLRDHWPTIKKRMGGFFTAISGLTGAVLGSTCNEADRDLAEKVITGLKLPGSARDIDKGTERADQCIALRAFGKKPLARFLRTH